MTRFNNILHRNRYGISETHNNVFILLKWVGNLELILLISILLYYINCKE